MWFPAHERHAIERVSVTLQFAEALPTKLWQTLINRVTIDFPRHGLDHVTDEVEMNFSPVSVGPRPFNPPISIGPNGVIIGGQAQNLPLAGKTFRAIKANAVTEEILIHRNRLVYATSVYDGWDVFNSRLASLASSFLTQALPVVTLGAFKLEYWDRFTFRGNVEAADFESLLKPASPYIGNFAVPLRDLWHSHVGFFADPGSSQKRLVNLNLDVVDVIEVAQNEGSPINHRSVGLYSMAQDSFGETTGPGDLAQAVSTLDEMHAILKDVLTNVITDEMAMRISLNRRTAQ